MAAAVLPRPAFAPGRLFARLPYTPRPHGATSFLQGVTYVPARHRYSTSSIPTPLATSTVTSRPTTPAPPAAHASPSPSLFSFHVAAAFIGKGLSFDPSHHTFELDTRHHHFPPLASAILRNKRIESGHDSFFISRHDDEGSVALGVADGVGGWVDMGVDPGDFSHAFCAYMAAASNSGSGRDGGRDGGRDAPATARKIMEKGYINSCHDDRLRAGGSTACVGLASPDGTLDVANLGDSGFLVLRSRAVHTSSPPQTHAFNTPYQLSLVPPHLVSRMDTFGGGHHIDLPADADVRRVSLRRGDVVVFATDGMWDNLFNQDILQVANKVMSRRGGWELCESEDGVRVSNDLEALVREGSSNDDSRGRADGRGPGKGASSKTLQRELAVELTVAAKAASMDKSTASPFSRSIRQHYDEHWPGGKVDDICVVVMVVADAGASIRKSRI